MYKVVVNHICIYVQSISEKTKTSEFNAQWKLPNKIFKAIYKHRNINSEEKTAVCAYGSETELVTDKGDR